MKGSDAEMKKVESTLFAGCMNTRELLGYVDLRHNLQSPN